MIKMKVGLAQMRSEKGDWQGNLDHAERFISDAKAQGCDIVVLPEMSLSGYCDPARFPHSVQTLASPWIARFVELTAKYAIAASGGFIEANPGGKPFISQVVAQDGRIICHYRKI